MISMISIWNNKRKLGFIIWIPIHFELNKQKLKVYYECLEFISAWIGVDVCSALTLQIAHVIEVNTISR